MTDKPPPVSPTPKPRQSREEILYDYFLENAQEIMGGLDRLQEKHKELRTNISEQRALFDRTAREVTNQIAMMLDRLAEENKKAAESRLTFARGFSEYCNDLSAKIVRSAVLGALGGGLMGG